MQLTCYRIEPSHWLYRLMSVCALCLAFCLPISISVYSIGLRLLVVFAFFILNFKDYCRQVFMNPLTGFILAFFCVLLLGQTYSHNVQYGWVDLHRYSKLICLPLLMPLFMNEKLRSKMIDAFVLGVSVVVLLTYLKVLHLYDFSPGALPGVGFTNHIDTSFVVALACFFVFRAIDWSQKQTYWRIAVFVFLTFYLFFINDGRMGYAVFMGLACLYCLQTFRLYYAAIALISCLLFLLIVYYFSLPVHAVVNKGFQDFMQTWQGHDNVGSIGVRLTFWRNSIALFKEAPWFGYGTGSYGHIYQAKQFWINSDVGDMRTGDNDYLFVLVQFGLVGLIIYLSLFVLMAYMTQQLDKPLRYFAQGNLLAIMIAQVFNAALYCSMIGTTFVVFSAVLLAAYLDRKGRSHADQFT